MKKSIYYQIGYLKSKIDILMREREIHVENIKTFENQLYHGFSFDAKMTAKYPEVYKNSGYAESVAYVLAVIDEQYKKLVAADCKIEKLYYKLSDTVKAANAAESAHKKKPFSNKRQENRYLLRFLHRKGKKSRWKL